ncbi:acetyltransferase [Pedobacter cryoconitis]|uniref:Acetyltransferase n=1 Tax=Pedobacter cryoconitis TaxID=188932 RepID=A0A127V8T1_9SPHI|nr:GNAT family N-acetyltransferase [Pedobacter cryoconitis]AMP97726.1 acetyltransferase [Pedobacter cryoconitis]
MSFKKIITERLYLIPFTYSICEQVLKKDFSGLNALGLKPGDGWPDADMLDTLPRIINKLDLVSTPSGFESWMIIEKQTHTVIGDTGFKGLPDLKGEADVGYGIIAGARRKGYATEAVKGLIGWAFQQPGLQVITASCEVKNRGSQQVLKSLGFSLIGTNESHYQWELKPAL